MNLRMAVLSHWKTILLAVHLSLLVMKIVTVTPLGDPIDDPIPPGLV